MAAAGSDRRGEQLVDLFDRELSPHLHRMGQRSRPNRRLRRGRVQPAGHRAWVQQAAHHQRLGGQRNRRERRSRSSLARVECGKLCDPAPRNASPQTGSAFYFRTGHRLDAQCITRLLGESDKPLRPMPDPPPGGLTLENLGNASILILIGPDPPKVNQPELPDPNNLPTDVESLVDLV